MATVKPAPRLAKDAMSDATEAYHQAAAGSAEAMRDQVERAMAAASEMSSFGKENMEAWIASTTAATKGVEALSARAMAYSKDAMEKHMSAAKAIMSSRSVQEVMEKQTEYARSAFDSYVAEMTKMSDLFANYTKDAMKPLNERVSAVSTLVQTAGRSH